MTIDEAIKHCEEVADQRETDSEMYRGAGLKADVELCLKCADEHRQLSRWLSELKMYRQILPPVLDYLNASGVIDLHEEREGENEEV